MGWRITAHYHLFKSADVTAGVLDLISKHEDYTSLFQASGKPRFLKIENPELAHWRPLSVRFGAPFALAAGEDTDFTRLKTRIVYFINCYINKNYAYLFRSQMRSLMQTGLLTGTAAEFHIVSSGTESDRAAIAGDIGRIMKSIPGIRHAHTEENAFEYPGIQKVWELGQKDPDAIILYFHARGISHLTLGRFRRNRQPQEKRLFRRVISEWRQNLTWLMQVTSADKVGLTCGGNGWVWYNFWYARGGYIAQLEKPVRTERRHYYEDWLGRFAEPGAAGYTPTLHRCLAIADSFLFRKYNLGSDFHPDDGGTHMGLPWGYAKICARRLIILLRKFFSRR